MFTTEKYLSYEMGIYTCIKEYKNLRKIQEWEKFYDENIDFFMTTGEILL